MSETPEIEPSSAAPGQILKRARESRNLTVAAIATLMNLDLRTIEALERGDLSKLPAPIFVRGYLRGYARLVGVAEAAVLEAYQAQAPQEPVPRGVGMSKVPVRPAFRAPALPWRGLLWVVIVLVAIGLGMQWGPQLIARFTGDAPQETAAVTEPNVDAPTATPGADTADVVPLGTDTIGGTTAPGAELPESSVGSPAKSPDELSDNGAPQALPLETPAPEESPASATPSVTTGSVDLSLPEQRPAPMSEAAPSATESAPKAPGDTDTAASATTASEAAASADQSAPPAPGEVRFELRLTENSWVDVRAADASKLVLGLLDKGQTRIVTGKAPVSVLLGNAAGVEIRVDGKVFDHRRYDRDNIARFEIGGKP